MTITDAFTATYDRAPTGQWSAPGRVNLIGEHTDYNDGFVLPFAIASRTTVAVSPRPDGLLRLRSAQAPDGDVAVHVDDLAPGSPDGWAAYVAGVVWAARESGHAVGGMDLLVDGRVPLGSGLSSSHALECAVALAVADLYAPGLDRDDLAVLCHRAENDFVGAPTGMMDQLACLRCTEGHALFLDIRSLHGEQVPLSVADEDLQLLVVDTRVHHAHGDGSYGNRRAACERAAKELGVRSLRDVVPTELAARVGQLDDELARRVRHVVTENARVLDAVEALRARDWGRVGQLMSESHRSLRDDYEVSAPELDATVTAALDAGALGARMTGGGFGGSAVVLCPADRESAVASAVRSTFGDRGWREPGVMPVTPSAGARRDG